MSDHLQDVGKSDRIRASLQKHEVQHIAQRFGISEQGAADAINAVGPMRDKVYAYIRAKNKAGDYT